MKNLKNILQRCEYRFAVYKHRLIIGTEKIITRQFVVIKDIDNNIISFTRLHKYIHSSNKKGSKSISDDGNNRFIFVTQFLNYVLFDQYSTNKIDKISDITLPMIQGFFRYYGLNENRPTKSRTKQTVDRCTTSVIDFMVNFIIKNKKECRLKIEDFTKKENYRTKRGTIKQRLVPNFQVFYSGISKPIFRDMPNAVFNIFLAYAAENYKDIFFLIVLSAFAGLRPSEACNVRQEISPLGNGLLFRKINGKTKKITIDISEEKNLRSDLINVGKIKKERKQDVYPKFLNTFEYCYNLHKEYLRKCSFESQYCPMSVNSRGRAMTYSNYSVRFRKMTKELIPILFNSDNPEIVEYAHDLQNRNISPHIFRHWFSVRLTLYGEDIAGLQYWRGDTSPESSLTYLQNKGELEKQLRTVSNGIFDFMLHESLLKKGEENV